MSIIIKSKKSYKEVVKKWQSTMWNLLRGQVRLGHRLASIEVIMNLDTDLTPSQNSKRITDLM